jgi:nucleoside-diphosphate-sugar epimerase
VTTHKSRILVTGAGGFIGHHLVNNLIENGHWVRGVDIRPPEFEPTRAHEFLLLDLRRLENCLIAASGIDQIYVLAANMGGIGFIESHKAEIIRDNTLINIHTLEAARLSGIQRLLFSSSACVYPVYRQTDENVVPLREEHAYPADPEDGYGWEKLFTERACRHYREDFGLETRIGRFHNIFGPLGAYEGGREKSPAAICRKVALARSGDSIDIWGDGEQTRSYCYIDDCIEGIRRLMNSSYAGPINVGQDRLVSINELVDIVTDISGKVIHKRHVSGPLGVRGRNSDNTRFERSCIGSLIYRSKKDFAVHTCGLQASLPADLAEAWLPEFRCVSVPLLMEQSTVTL